MSCANIKDRKASKKSNGSTNPHPSNLAIWALVSCLVKNVEINLIFMLCSIAISLPLQAQGPLALNILT